MPTTPFLLLLAQKIDQSGEIVTAVPELVEQGIELGCLTTEWRRRAALKRCVLRECEILQPPRRSDSRPVRAHPRRSPRAWVGHFRWSFIDAYVKLFTWACTKLHFECLSIAIVPGGGASCQTDGGGTRQLQLDHSTLNRRLAALERDLSTKLFDRCTFFQVDLLGVFEQLSAHHPRTN
jgi:hypothetical protein